MDRDTLIGIVEKKHHFRVDPNDPVFVLATISDVMLQEAQGELRKIVTEAMNQTAVASRQAEAAAQVKVEAIVREAGESAAERIREAGEAAATRILTEAQQSQRDAAVTAQQIRRSARVLLVCSVAALAASVIAVVKLWIG